MVVRSVHYVRGRNYWHSGDHGVTCTYGTGMRRDMTEAAVPVLPVATCLHRLTVTSATSFVVSVSKSQTSVRYQASHSSGENTTLFKTIESSNLMTMLCVHRKYCTLITYMVRSPVKVARWAVAKPRGLGCANFTLVSSIISIRTIIGLLLKLMGLSSDDSKCNYLNIKFRNFSGNNVSKPLFLLPSPNC